VTTGGAEDGSAHASTTDPPARSEVRSYVVSTPICSTTVSVTARTRRFEVREGRRLARAGGIGRVRRLPDVRRFGLLARTCFARTGFARTCFSRTGFARTGFARFGFEARRGAGRTGVRDEPAAFLAALRVGFFVRGGAAAFALRAGLRTRETGTGLGRRAGFRTRGAGAGFARRAGLRTRETGTGFARRAGFATRTGAGRFRAGRFRAGAARFRTGTARPGRERAAGLERLRAATARFLRRSSHRSVSSGYRSIRRRGGSGGRSRRRSRS